MAQRMADGGAVLLFAEGQSDIGTHVLPFRTALVGAAQQAMLQGGAREMLIQPLTISYTRLQGLPVSRNERSLIAWIKSKSVGQNIREILTGGVKEVTLAFGSPIPLAVGSDRKAVTRAAELEVRRALVALNRGQQVPATGFSFGVSRFAAALSALGRLEGADAAPLVIVVAADKARMAEYFAMAAQLRAAGLRAEAFTGNGNMGKQMKYADRRGAVAAVIIGSDEREQGLVTIKDLKLGARLAAEISDNKEWREDQPAQMTVASDAWIEAVRIVAKRDDKTV